MPYNGLNDFINTLKLHNEIVEINEYINPVLEITEITDRVSKNNGPALLFKNTGTKFPLLINAYGSKKRMELALGVNELDDIPKEIESLFKDLTHPKTSFWEKLKLLPTLKDVAGFLPKTKKGKGKCQEIIDLSPNIFSLPVLQSWPYDGGRFLTLPVIHTKDPETGIRNVGMYRVQLFEPNLCAIHWQLHKVSRKHYEKYKRLEKKMPVAITLGGDPSYAYAATAPLPENVDEYLLAGFIRKKAVKLVKCITQDIEVPEDADIVIEGFVDPEELLALEGPFGDHTGFYSLPDFYPKFHITAITYRKDAVFPATIVGIPPQEDKWLGKATERIFIAPIKMTMVPEIIDMNLPAEGVFHNMAIIKIHKEFPGQAFKVMNALWGAGQMMFTKIMVIVDQNAPDLNNYPELAEYILKQWNPESDTLILQGPMDVLDHSAPKMAFGGKLGIDATEKMPEEIHIKPFKKHSKHPENIHKTIKKIYPATKNTTIKFGKILIISVEKDSKIHLKNAAKNILQLPEFQEIKLLIFLDKEVDIEDNLFVFWVATNNTDIRNDLLFYEDNKIAFDCTRKTAKEGFHRDWPNPTTMDEKTIKKIDEIWDKLNLGEFIPSPSLKYSKLNIGKGAIAYKNDI